MALICPECGSAAVHNDDIRGHVCDRCNFVGARREFNQHPKGIGSDGSRKRVTPRLFEEPEEDW